MSTAIPRHVAIIPDGNRRWADQRGLAPMEGHRMAYDNLFDIARVMADRGVLHATFFAFSTENWQRAEREVGFLLALLEHFVFEDMRRFAEAGFRLRFFGSRQRLGSKIVKGMERVESETAANGPVTINICFNYGGRQDIVEAVRGIVRDGIPPDEIDGQTIADHLSSHDSPPLDLVVRTSGEQRLSNYLLWEAAYAELVFSDCLWPDFGEVQIDEVLAEYARRKRRFGA